MEEYSIKQNKYIKGDSFEYVSQMIERNEKVNALIFDPPYGINHSSNRRSKNDRLTKDGIINDEEDNEDFLKKAIELSYQVLEDESHIYWFTRWDKLEVHIPLLRRFYNIKNVIIWDKGNHGSGDLLGAYGNKYECIIYGMKGRRTLNRVDGTLRHQDIFTDFSKVHSSKLRHPHQKPIDLLKFLIKKSTNEGEVILDMFGGIGSLLIASILTNRRSIVIEKTDKFYNVGLQYIQEQIKKTN